MQLGQLIAFINYLMQTLMSLMMVSHAGGALARAEASARAHPGSAGQRAAMCRPARMRCNDLPPRGRVAFENVSFSYDGDEQRSGAERRSALRPSRGRRSRCWARPAAGKSSLVNLIPRFYDVTGGRVTIDGVDVRDDRRGSAAAQRSAIALQEVDAVQRHHPRQHPLRPAGRQRRRGDRRGQNGPGARFHHSLPRRLRYDGRASAA